MKTYKSNSNYLFMEIIFVSIIMLVVIYTIVSTIEIFLILISCVLVIILLYIFLIKKLLKKIINIEFKENIIQVKYRFNRKIERIEYSEIDELKYVEASRSPTSNILKYKRDNGRILKLKFYSVVDRNEMMEFVKWIKQKNNKIKFKFSTLDMKLDYEYQKEFGLKYRKYIKKTLE